MIIAERRVVAGRASLPVPFQTLPGCGGPADPGLAPPRPAPPHPAPAVASPPEATQTPSVAQGVELH